MKVSAVSVLLVLACSSLALADEVVLRNGHRVIGIQTEEKDRIVVETGYGTVSYPRTEVVSVTKGDTPLHAWPVRYAEIEKSTNAADFTKLAEWARENGMPKYVRPLMQRAIELDADNAEARAALGFVRHEGRWIPQHELRKKQGQVQEGGRWMDKLERELAERRRIEAESRKLDREAETKKKEEQRRRIRREEEIRHRVWAAQTRPPAHDGPFWDQHASYWGRGWGGVNDFVTLDWLLSFINGGGSFPLGAPRGRVIHGHPGEPGPISPTFP
jgi:hypothetical protein